MDPRHGPPVLIKPKYVGDNVWNRVSFKLKKQRRPDIWVRPRARVPFLPSARRLTDGDMGQSRPAPANRLTAAISSAFEKGLVR